MNDSSNTNLSAIDSINLEDISREHKRPRIKRAHSETLFETSSFRSLGGLELTPSQIEANRKLFEYDLKNRAHSHHVSRKGGKY